MTRQVVVSAKQEVKGSAMSKRRHCPVMNEVTEATTR
jgi:hypothetical protein